MDCGSNIFRSFDFGKRARTFKLNSFVGLYLTNTPADLIYQIYTPFLVRSSRGSSRKNKSRIFGLLRNSQFSHLIYARVHAVMPPTNETLHRTPWQISWQGTLEIRGKGHFAKLGTRINMQIKIPDESPRKKSQHSAGGLSCYDTFRSWVLVTLKHSFSRISRSS